MKIKAIKGEIIKEFSENEWRYMPPDKFGFKILENIPPPIEVLESKKVEVSTETIPTPIEEPKIKKSKVKSK